MFFLGWTISAIIIPKLADKIGRKPVLQVIYVALLPISVGIILSKSILFTTAMLFLLGITANGTCSIAFVFMIEAIVPEWRAIAGSWFNIFGFSQPFCIGFYFKFIYNQFFHVLVFAFILQVVAVAIIFAVIEESPLFLMKKGESHRAIEILSNIHRLNTGYKNKELIHPLLNIETGPE